MKTENIVGKIQGDRALLFPDFYYRKPIVRPITSIFDLDPYRLNPTEEYPRSVCSPRDHVAPITTETLVDFAVEFIVKNWCTEVTVWLLHNEYTSSRKDQAVLSVTLDGLAGGNFQELADYMIGTVCAGRESARSIP
jgi:hypothetical protein